MRNLIIGAFLILFTIITFAFYVMKIYQNDTYDIVLNIIFFYTTMVYVLVNYQFFFATFNIKLRFELLNDCLMWVNNENLETFGELIVWAKLRSSYVRMHKIILNIFRSQFAHKAISCTEISQSFTDSLRMKLVREIAIMHDKLNDAVEMINSSFSCEVRSGMLYMTLTYLVLIFHFHARTAAAWNGLCTLHDNAFMLHNFPNAL